MKKIIMLLVVIFTLANAIGQESMSNPNNEARNKKIAIEVYNAMQENNLDAAFNHFDKNVLVAGNGGANANTISADTLKMQSKTSQDNWKEAFPDHKEELISAAADGDYVMLYTSSTGTWKNNFGIWQASGKPYKMTDVLIYKFNIEGKIIAVQNIMPMVSLMDQVGDGGEFDLNKAGYALLAQKKYNEAIEIFTLNVKLYPKSSNVYDSLGEAYMLAGNKAKAIENYETSVKMDPKNENGFTALKKLKEK